MLPETRARRRLIIIVAALAAAFAALAVALRKGEQPAPLGPRSSATPHGPVTVAVYEEGSPLEGRWVVFQDAAGNVVRSERTGKDGKVAGDIEADGMVTVAQGTSVQQMFTFVGVQPGDALVFGERIEEEGVATTVGTSKLKLPGPYAAAARYTLNLGVGVTETVDPGAVIRLPVLGRFVVDGTKFKALGEAVDRNGEAIAFAFAWVPWSADQSKAHGEVDVKLPPWSAEWRTFELSLSNAPKDITSADGKLTIYAKDEDRFERAPRRAELHEQKALLRFPVPPPLGSEARYSLELAYGSSRDRAVLVHRAESMPTTVAIDVASAILPRVSNAGASATTDPSRPIARWDVASDPSAADVMVVRVAWPATREHVWTIAAPPGAPRSVRLPALPGELATWRPDGRPMSVAAALVEASFYDGYADVRRKGIQLVSEPPEDATGSVSLRKSVCGDLEF